MSHVVKSISLEMTPAEFQYVFRVVTNSSFEAAHSNEAVWSIYKNLKTKIDAIKERLDFATTK